MLSSVTSASSVTSSPSSTSSCSMTRMTGGPRSTMSTRKGPSWASFPQVSMAYQVYSRMPSKGPSTMG